MMGASCAFIVGVPRSGTTLLRVLLGSHTQIASAPETPWIVGGYGKTSMRQLVNGLTKEASGPLKNLTGVDRGVIISGARYMVQSILECYLESVAKPFLVLKTPDDIAHVEFLVELFPDARLIHIVRDGRDVACSSAAKRNTGWGDKLNGGYGVITIENAMKRWATWEAQAADALAKLPKNQILKLRFEDLVGSPVAELQKVTLGLGLNFEPEMLRYWNHSHILPEWEAGSSDILAHRSISSSNVGRWRNELRPDQARAIWEKYSVALQWRGYTEY